MIGNARELLRPAIGVSALALLLACPTVAFAQTADTLAERRAHVEQMSPEDRDQLSQNYDRFLHLDHEQRDRLRRLDADLTADPDRAELQKVMQRYHEWLSELPAAQRMMLAALPPEERLKRIDEFRTMWGHRSRLSPADVQAFQNWVKTHDLQRAWDEARREHRQPEISPAQLADLRSQLSEPAQRSLDEAKQPEDMRRLLFSWVMHSRRGMGSGGFRGPSEQEMAEFLKTGLSESERAYLSALPPEQMERESNRLWRQKHGRGGERGGDRGGPPGGRSFGPGGPGRERTPAERPVETP